jgi:hypothetical protein
LFVFVFVVLFLVTLVHYCVVTISAVWDSYLTVPVTVWTREVIVFAQSINRLRAAANVLNGYIYV